MRTNKVLGAILIGGLLFSGCAKDPAENVPSASVASTPASATTPADGGTPVAATPIQGKVYNFTEGSEVGFVGSKVTGSHEGGFKKMEGKVTVPDDNVEAAVVDLTVDTTSVYTDADKLTEHLMSEDFFATTSHPTAKFVSKSITKTDTGYDVSGDLTLRGVTKAISFPAEITVEGDSLTTKAEFSINRKDFNIVYAGKPDDLIREDVVIKFDITANSQDTGA